MPPTGSGKRAAAGGAAREAKRARGAVPAAFEELEHVLVAEVPAGDEDGACPDLYVVHPPRGDDDSDSDCDDDDDDNDDDSASDGGSDQRKDGSWEGAADRLLETFCHPMPVDAFMSAVHQRKAMAVHGPPERFAGVIEEHLCGLDLSQLVQETASENVFVWMRSTTTPGTLNSFEVDDPSAALKCFDSGASLYFRSPEAMAEAYVRSMSHAIGANFAGQYADGAPRGEIEVFVSRPGHVTPWHFDYMDNFTLQLRGRKTWHLKRSTVPHPQRGCTPHYKGIDTFEQQLKVHRQEDPAFRLQPPDDHFAGSNAVELRPGSVLYHPPGIWHKVESTGSDDSVSINISLMPSSWADLAADAVRQLLTRRLPWREAVCLRRADASAAAAAVAAQGTDRVVAMMRAGAGRGESWARDYASARAQAAERLARLQADVASLTVDDLVPPALVLPRVTPAQIAEAAGAAEPAAAASVAGVTFRVNPLAVLFRAADALARRDKDDGDDGSDGGGGDKDGGSVPFVVHAGFGNEELASAVRRVVRAAAGAEAGAMDALARRRPGETFASDAAGLPPALLLQLVDAGLLTVAAA